MNDLITRIGNQDTRDAAYGYSKNEGMREDEFIFSMVYDFAKNLPYSMDIQQQEYVPADFLNMTPYEFENDRFFKWEESRTVYKAMTSWGDAFESGVVLQMCAVFQKMLSKQFPNDYCLEDDDFYLWGIDQMTSNKEYNKSFFETLKSLPDYYKRVQAAKTNEERRKILDDIYAEMQNGIAHKSGGLREIASNGNVIKEFKPPIVCEPVFDLLMLYRVRNVEYSREIPKLKEIIRKQDKKRLEDSQKTPEIELAGDEK